MTNLLALMFGCIWERSIEITRELYKALPKEKYIPMLLDEAYEQPNKIRPINNAHKKSKTTQLG